MEAPVVPAVKGKKNTGAIIGSVAAIVLCGVVGLCLLCPFGIVLAAKVWDANGKIPNWTGYISLCLSVIFIAIGVVVPIVLLRKKKEPAEATVLPPSEPLPPAA